MFCPTSGTSPIWTTGESTLQMWLLPWSSTRSVAAGPPCWMVQCRQLRWQRRMRAAAADSLLHWWRFQLISRRAPLPAALLQRLPLHWRPPVKDAWWLCSRSRQAGPVPSVIRKLTHVYGSTSTCSETMTSGQWTMRSATSVCHTVRPHVMQTVTQHTYAAGRDERAGGA